MFEGRKVYIGKSELFDEVPGERLPPELKAEVDALSKNGRTTMIVRAGDTYLGVIGLMDTPREAAKSVIQALRDVGVQRSRCGCTRGRARRSFWRSHARLQGCESQSS